MVDPYHAQYGLACYPFKLNLASISNYIIQEHERTGIPNKK